MKRLLHENYNLSCKIIKHFILTENDDSLKQLMFKDFLSKGSKIRPVDFQNYLIDVLQVFLPQKLQYIIDKFDKPVIEIKKHIDVAIVTIIEPELKAIAHALEFDLIEKENRNINGIRFWEKTLSRDNHGSQISLLITMIGEARNVPCAIGCERMFANYDIDLCILIGIAAGLKDKVNLGDVVAARSILDFEHQRLEPDNKFKKRPDQFPLDTRLDRDLNFFFTHKEKWQQKFLEAYRKFQISYTPFNRRKKIIPNFHTGVVVAGEKLFADGSLPEMCNIYHDKIRAVEMEGSGFARACRDYNVPWLVFRGISDFGDPEKRDEWQLTAALSASIAALTFLFSIYRLAEEVEL